MKGTLLEDGSTKKGAPVFIVLSDGESRDRLTMRDQYIIDKFQRDSRLQIAVGVGDNFNRDELERGFIYYTNISTCCSSKGLAVKKVRFL